LIQIIINDHVLSNKNNYFYFILIKQIKNINIFFNKNLLINLNYILSFINILLNFIFYLIRIQKLLQFLIIKINYFC